jgi:hypothetical protein
VKPQARVLNAQTLVGDTYADDAQAGASLKGVSWNSVLQWFTNLGALRKALQGATA